MSTLPTDLGIRQTMADDQRRRTRRDLSEQEFKGVQNSSPGKRYKYFLNEVLGHEEVWVCFLEDDLLMQKDSLGYLCPVWAHELLAFENAAKFHKNAESVPVPIEDWIKEVIYKDLRPNEIRLAVMHIPGEECVALSCDQLLEDMSAEAKLFAKYAGDP